MPDTKKYWEWLAEHLKKRGWAISHLPWKGGCIAVAANARQIHIVRADEPTTAFFELDRSIRDPGRRRD